MTTPPAVDPAVDSPDLDQQIIAASRAYIAAQTTRPRDPATIAAAKATLDALIAQRDAGT